MTSPQLCLDAASGLFLGRREVQQDVLACDFPLGSELGLAVLADGMGGQPAGEVAAQIVVTEVFADLKLRGAMLGQDLPANLRRSAQGANRCLSAHSGSHPATLGMGTTLLAAVIDRMRLSFLSVGDSLLFLYRAGTLRQLNKRHSVAERLDAMAEANRLTVEAARAHPERHLLTSCLNGAAIAEIDCPERPIPLQPGDLVLMASDGIETLGRAELALHLGESGGKSAAQIILTLLAAVKRAGRPDQDNLSLILIRPQMLSEEPWRRPRTGPSGRSVEWNRS